MTREEAIYELLNAFKYNVDDLFMDACNMAIEALSEETSTIQEKHQLSEETSTNTSTNISTDASADRPRGHWIVIDEYSACSVCDAEIDWYDLPYCPYCGAKMDGKRSE